ncbi:MAG TPA: hypothetical protein VG621_03295 [Candidatus Paceibacterota bacterium]|nr:hypothetical protein [Candidatus Paceibacterota bacterium]
MSELSFPESVIVTAQKIDLSLLTKEGRDFYKTLFSDIVALYQSKNKNRVVVGFTGPTGSGKSVITSLFLEFAKQIPLSFEVCTLTIDAFHFPNEYLESHVDTVGKKLKEVKGRFDTYDVQKLLDALVDFKEGKRLSLPIYSRELHNPVENAVSVISEKALLIIEGLWLLYPHGLWRKLAPLLDFKIFIEADKEKSKTRWSVAMCEADDRKRRPTIIMIP